MSVVIPTYRRHERLSRGLLALWAQVRAPDEVCVVVREDDRETLALIERERAAGRPIRPVRVDVPGVVAAMDAGFGAARGEVVALTDDDTEPHPDWLARIEAAFAADQRLGAAGGRDWVRYDGRLIDGAETVVGEILWYGRVIGNHHVGTGPPREVRVLKGANMAFRCAALQDGDFDRRLLGVGTEHHWELMICLRLEARGWKLLYDPAIGVDHNPAPRVEGTRHLKDVAVVRYAAHNETLSLLEHLPRGQMAAYFAWALSIGSVAAPGAAYLARSLVRDRTWQGWAASAALRGRADAFRTRRRSRTIDGVLAIGHSSYAADRARQLLGCRVVHAGPGLAGIRRAARAALTARERTLYLVDVGMSTSAAAVVGRLRRRRVVLDTGDLAYELARSVGNRGRLGLAAVRAGEWIAVRCADHVIVRGRAHADFIPDRPVTHVPDVAPAEASPADGSGVRARLGLDAAFVAGLVGSLNDSERLGRGYGWDLIEALASTSDDVHALIVGDGDGQAVLERRAAELGVADRCHFVGRVPPSEVGEFIAAMDVGISTQTNDAVGSVRTTGKLPLYLACGLPVLASDVGEAARVLGPHGWTVRYDGVVDDAYPQRLGEALQAWADDREGQERRRALAIAVSEEHFDVAEIRSRLRAAVMAGGSTP